MPSKYPHAQFHTGEELYTWLTEQQRADESMNQTARRLLLDQMNRSSETTGYTRKRIGRRLDAARAPTPANATHETTGSTRADRG